MRERLEFYLRDVARLRLRRGERSARRRQRRCGRRDRTRRSGDAVRGSEDFASISVAFKRIKNILRQATRSRTKSIAARSSDGFAPTEDDAEQDLAQRGARIRTQRCRDFARKDNYAEALGEISRAFASPWTLSSTR